MGSTSTCTCLHFICLDQNSITIIRRQEIGLTYGEQGDQVLGWAPIRKITPSAPLSCASYHVAVRRLRLKLPRCHQQTAVLRIKIIMR
jgi:hypothetical protein